MAVDDLGLDLSNVYETSPAEIDAFRTNLINTSGLGYPLVAYNFWLESRPDVAKLHRRQLRQLHTVPDARTESMLMTGLSMLHYYVIHRFEDGILGEIRNVQRQGATKAQVLEVVAVAFLHSGPSGMRYVHSAAAEYIRTYRERPERPRFPEGWAPDASAFQCGLDMSTDDLTLDDQQRLNEWFIRNVGEVPRSIAFLERHQPRYLKAWRLKWEGAIRDALPKQVMPYLMLHYNMNRGFQDGVREAALLGRSWGVSKEWIINAVTTATCYMGGFDAVTIASDAISDLLDAWD